MAGDWRNINNGLEIPSERYADQPYIVITPEGDWICTLTTGRGAEGEPGQHVVATISKDKGRSWSELIEIEPADGPSASWIVPYITPYGRIYGFYTYNGDNVHLGRDDTHGWYCFRYSDDGGRTWSRRYRLPMRVTACDRNNGTKESVGRLVQMFWGIDKPSTVDGRYLCWAFTKLGRYFLQEGEGWVWRCDNILTERDPDKLRWQLLPDGERGIRNDGFGSVQEEHNLAWLGGDNLICIYRTTQGWPACSYSRDGGHTWSKPEPLRYTPAGRIFKQPRACPKIWRCENGRFLFWFHHNSTKGFAYGLTDEQAGIFTRNLPEGTTPSSRNPVFIVGGVLKDGYIHWSQPEILLYDPDFQSRMSYPDLIEDEGEYYVTETNKLIARVHHVDRQLLEGMWSQVESNEGEMIRDGLALEVRRGDLDRGPQVVKAPEIPDLSKDGGFAVEIWLKADRLVPGEVLLDGENRENGRGFKVILTENRTIELSFSDGRYSADWDIDRGLIEPGKDHHILFIVDGAADIITAVVDGVLCDGGDRHFGWSFFRHELGDINGVERLRIAPSFSGSVKLIRIYDRYLRTAEAVSSFRAERPLIVG